MANLKMVKSDKLFDFVNKYSKRILICLVFVVSFVMLSLFGFYLWLNYHTMAQIGDYKINRRVVLDNIAGKKDFILQVKGDDANLEKETYRILLEEKAIEYETKKRNITISNEELEKEVVLLSEDSDSDKYYQTVKTAYGWSKDEANAKVSSRMLKEKLEQEVVSSYDVDYFFVRADAEPQAGESREQVKAKALEIIEDSREKAISGIPLKEIHSDIIKNYPPTWNGDMTHGWGSTNDLNASNEGDNLANGRYWPEIVKLEKPKDATGIIDATNEGGLYIFWQLTNKNNSSFISMDEFYKSFEKRNRLTSFLLRMSPKAYACSDWINVNANTTDERNYYRVDKYYVYVREASTHALITNHAGANVVLRNIESEIASTPHCSASWCTMNHTENLGTNGLALIENTCCQFWYETEITDFPGHSFVHAYRDGTGSYDGTTTHYPVHVNGDNGVDMMKVYIDFNPVNYTVTPSADAYCLISPTSTATVHHGGSTTWYGNPGGVGYSFSGFEINGILSGNNIWNGTAFQETISNITRNTTVKAKCTCTPTSQTSTRACPAGQTGTIYTKINYTCPGGWGSWYDTSNTCAATCTPRSETGTSPCPAGETGIINTQRNYSCPAGTWGSWYNTSSTCVNTAPAVTLVSPINNPTLPVGTTSVDLAAYSVDNSNSQRIAIQVYDPAGNLLATDGFGVTLYTNNQIKTFNVADLTPGIYRWRAQSVDANNLYSAFVEDYFTIPVVPTLTCTVTPQEGTSPLVVRVTVTGSGHTGTPATAYSYRMNAGVSTDLQEQTSRPAEIYYTYPRAGSYQVQAWNAATDWRDCLPASVTVSDPGSGDTGEITP